MAGNFNFLKGHLAPEVFEGLQKAAKAQGLVIERSLDQIEGYFIYPVGTKLSANERSAAIRKAIRLADDEAAEPFG